MEDFIKVLDSQIDPMNIEYNEENKQFKDTMQTNEFSSNMNTEKNIE